MFPEVRKKLWFWSWRMKFMNRHICINDDSYKPAFPYSRWGLPFIEEMVTNFCSLVFSSLFVNSCHYSRHTSISLSKKKKQLWLKPQNRKISGKVGFYCLHFDCIKIVAYTKSRIQFCLMPAARNSEYSRIMQKSSVNNFSVREIHC